MPIEGHGGNYKRRFGLDHIVAKLVELAKTKATLALLDVNANHRLVCWRVHLSLSLQLAFLFLVFQ